MFDDDFFVVDDNVREITSDHRIWVIESKRTEKFRLQVLSFKSKL